MFFWIKNLAREDVWQNFDLEYWTQAKFQKTKLLIEFGKWKVIS